MKQLHLSRRIGPLIPPLAPLFINAMKAMRSDAGIIGSLDMLAPLAQPFMDSLASMSDEDVEYVISLSLSTVKRARGNIWTPVWNEGAKRAMFEELNDIVALMPIVMYVIKDNLGPFIEGVLTRSSDPTDQPQE